MRDPAPAIVILGPTASGKTRLAAGLAGRIRGSIISADSRQIYRGLDIGAGKDLQEYGDIPYYMIDLLETGEKYDLSRFVTDAGTALTEIRSQGRQPIICGGTGLYIQGLIQGHAYSDVPRDDAWREPMQAHDIGTLREILREMPHPEHFSPDTSTKKRLIRAIEICRWTAEHPGYQARPPLCPDALVFGINPDRELRRARISQRLQDRLQNGLIEETRSLLDMGLSPDQLIYYGLEYKYTTLYLTGALDYPGFVSRLEAEIHRFAKRQMTFFRKMEKDGIHIHWIQNAPTDKMLTEILHKIKNKKFGDNT